MRKFFYFLLIMAFTPVLGCVKETPLNEMPMYNNVSSPEMQKLHDKFIKDEVALAGSREAGAKRALDAGRYYYDQHDYKSAMKRVNQAWLLDKSNPVIYLSFGLVLDAQGKWDEALKMYSKAIELKPDFSSCYNNIAIIYREQKQYDKSITYFGKAIETDPKNGQYYFNRSAMYLEMKEFDKSWEDIHKAQKLGLAINASFLNDLKRLSKRDN